MTKFLLLLGPSGVGKTTIIHELKNTDNRFVYISPFVTRPLRIGENDKFPISNEELEKMQAKGEILTVTSLYGVNYATPISPIIQAFDENRYPVLDWPISKIDTMRKAFPERLFTVYLEPPSLKELHRRLKRDGRDTDGRRYLEAELELGSLWSGELDSLYDFKVVNRKGFIKAVSEEIYSEYRRSLGEGVARGKEFE